VETLKKIVSNQYFPAAAVLTVVVLFWTIAMFGGLSLLHNNQPPIATLTWMLFVYGAAVLTPLAGIIAAADLVRRWRRNRQYAQDELVDYEGANDELSPDQAAETEPADQEVAPDQAAETKPAQDPQATFEAPGQAAPETPGQSAPEAPGQSTPPTQQVQYRSATHQPAKKQTNQRKTAA
jgi:hypothetical protein